jgi:hypothetical protein
VMADGKTGGADSEAAPAAPFKVLRTELVLELLVTALYAPAELRQPDEGARRGAVSGR